MKTAHFACLALAASTLAHGGALTVTVIDKDGKPVPEAVVVVQPAQRTGAAPVLPALATIVQEKMQFLPAVTVVPVGAKVIFMNQDTWDHHVRGTRSQSPFEAPAAGGGFELRIEGRKPPAPPKGVEVTFDDAGPLLLSCHLHGSMRGNLFVASSPWTLKTAADGTATFDSVPDGAARVSVWHPDQLSEMPASAITLGATAVKIGLQLQVVPRRRRL